MKKARPKHQPKGVLSQRNVLPSSPKKKLRLVPKTITKAITTYIINRDDESVAKGTRCLKTDR